MHPAAKHATEHAWQKTGRTAPKEHHDGLSPELWVEFVGLDDDGKTQGRVLAYLTAEGGRTKHGNIFVGHVIAAEDEYYAYWLDSSFGAYRLDKRVLMHFCHTHGGRCKDETIYKAVLHVDVFRILEHDMLEKLTWIKDEAKARRILA